jgi:hypothetical protein
MRIISYKIVALLRVCNPFSTDSHFVNFIIYRCPRKKGQYSGKS